MCTTYNGVGPGVNAVAGARILLLMTYRPGSEMPGLAHSHVSQLAVSRLSPRIGVALLRDISSEDQVPVGLAETIVEKASGNPFFLEELTWSAVTERGHSLSVSVPGTVADMLRVRIDRLRQRTGGPQAAAIIGRDAQLAREPPSPTSAEP